MITHSYKLLYSASPASLITENPVTVLSDIPKRQEDFKDLCAILHRLVIGINGSDSASSIDTQVRPSLILPEAMAAGGHVCVLYQQIITAR